jgi:hypothetical protein
MYLQELDDQVLSLRLIRQVASTNLKRNLGDTKDSLCDWIQLQGAQ